jgi:L,D-transpeptidase YcbB
MLSFFEKGFRAPGSLEKMTPPTLALFDDMLHERVVEFQERNGLAADGIVGPATSEALGYSVYERISTIRVNLERWRRLDALGDHYILVNIPDYRLSVIKEGRTMLSSDVVVGQRHRQTPVLSSVLTKMELNPFWFVPPGMLRNKIIPAVRRDIGYLEKNNMVVLDRNWRRVDPGSVDWHSGFSEGFPYIIRQEPGPGNEMGRIKFLFPNRNYVTIHGTPYTHLFSQNIRAFSAGCIRIRTPLQLADYLVNIQGDRTMGQLLEVLDSNEFQRVEFVNPLPLHILYFTAWAGEDGVTDFRKDIYSLDPPLLEALQQRPPGYEHEISVQLPAGLAVTAGELPNQADK